MLLVALAILVLAGRGQHFFYDEWAFVGTKLDYLPLPDRYFYPHSEHWSLLPFAAYRILGATVGVGSYWPYLGLLLLLHLGVTHILWRLMLATGSTPLLATALAAVFSVLGAAADDLVWAFQIGFVGSTLLGITAVYLAITWTPSWPRTALISGLVLAAMATSGIGVPYLIVVPLVLAWHHRGHALAVFGSVLLVYALWYTTYGHPLAHGPNTSATLPLMVGAFVGIGMTAALTGYSGLEFNLATILLIAAPLLAGMTLTCFDWRAKRTLARHTVSAMFLGAIAFFASAGLARAGLGVASSASHRYVYVAMALLLPAVAFTISPGVSRFPWLTKAIVPLALAMAVSNVLQLFTYASEVRQNNDASRAILVAASSLVQDDSPVFADQLPEPVLAPDLATWDLRSRYLDPAFAGVRPQPSDRLTASLNLQLQVVPVQDTGTPPACGGVLQQVITVRTSRGAAARFVLRADAVVALTLHDAGSISAQRTLSLSKGTYVVNSMRDRGDLTIDSTSPGPLLATC